MKFSEFGRRFSGESGINRLMEDLGEALAGSREMLMLGGGNPAHIPEVQSFFQDRLHRLAENPAEFARVIGDYDAPRGEPRFLKALADLLNQEYGWKLTPDHLALTAGSQSSFFLLFNMLAGEMGGGEKRHVLLPMTPEYIGYADVGLEDRLFRANRPAIELQDDRTFKYHVDFDRVVVDRDTAAICVSRPTNPTGNVLTDGEMEKLHALARTHDIPLIVDNAYGLPFPSIIFTEASMPFSDHVILCMSLSKLGLPGVRTGIVIARPEIAGALARMNAIFNLAMGSVGPALAIDLVTSGEILNLSRKVIRPYYERRAQHVIDLFRQSLHGVDYRIHRAEGAIFLWLWFPGLPITSEELYQRLKRRGTIVVSGHYFFPGLAEEWPHRHECIRVSYTMREDVVRRGVAAIAEEVRKAFAEST
jgi:valine--pyruvate aminotransferase